MEGFSPFDGLSINSLAELKPGLVGEMHTLVFEKFGELYANQESLSPIDLMMDASRIMASFCVVGDYTCKALTSKATIKAFKRAYSETEEQVKYPESMDQKVKNHLELANTVIDSLNEDNLDDVVNMLNTIQTDLENLEDVIPEYQSVGVASLSVAIESAKFWSKVVKDESHPLYSVVNGRKEDDRRLQTAGSGIDITVEIDYEVIFANINYVVSQTVGQAIKAVESVVNTVFVVVTNVVDMTTDAIVATVSAIQDAALSVVAFGTEVAVALYDVGSEVVAATLNAGIDFTTATVTAGIAIFSATIEAGYEVTTAIAEGVFDVVSTTAEVAVQVADATVDAGAAIVGGAVDTAILATETAVDVGSAVVETSLDVVVGGLEAGVDAAGFVVDTAVTAVESTVGLVQDTAMVVAATVAGVTEGISRIVRADYEGASTGGAFMVDQIISNPVLLFPLNWIPIAVVTAFWYSIPSSATSGFRKALLP